MIELIKTKINFEIDPDNYEEYKEYVADIIEHKAILSLENFVHHHHTNRLNHSLQVSYRGFEASKKLGLDSRSVARGGLLHDFYLYDRKTVKPKKWLHNFTHPNAALRNANKYFDLNKKEEDIIIKHMWPMTIIPPKYKESLVIIAADKYCASLEVTKLDTFYQQNLLVEMQTIN
ncbi:MAG: HD family phosphohydrolase [Bacillota bacterium]